MKSVVWGAVVAACAVAAAAQGKSTEKALGTHGTYAQVLVERELARHPGLRGLAMFVAPPQGGASAIIACNDPTVIGRKAGPTELDVAKSGRSHSAAANGRYEVELPLQDASARTLGTLKAVFDSSAGADTRALEAQAEAVRSELARRISHARNLLESAVIDTRVPLDTYAQKLVDQSLDAHPEILIMAIHATIPNTHDNVIVASNIGRIGKQADEDDLRVVNSGKPNLEVNETGDRFEAELALEDAGGRNIGAIGIVYPYKAGDDKVALQRKAEQVRDELARRIPAAASLFAGQS